MTECLCHYTVCHGQNLVFNSGRLTKNSLQNCRTKPKGSYCDADWLRTAENSLSLFLQKRFILVFIINRLLPDYWNMRPTSSTLVQHCVNVIQIFRAYWDDAQCSISNKLLPYNTKIYNCRTAAESSLILRGFWFLSWAIKGRICHSSEWQIRPFNTEVTLCTSVKDEATYGVHALKINQYIIKLLLSEGVVITCTRSTCSHIFYSKSDQLSFRFFKVLLAKELFIITD